jgi:hypothetical protein
VVGVVARDEILEDGAGFEEVDGLAIREGIVSKCGDAAVGVDGEEGRALLLIFAEGYGVDLVGETA